MRVSNPYLDAALPHTYTPKRGEHWAAKFDHLLSRGLDGYRARDELTKRYSWAIPTPNALVAIAKLAPIVEMGAGTGYWAHLLREMGTDVVAYDAAPPDGPTKNPWHATATGTWTEVLAGGPADLARHGDRTLLICWPPYDEPMAAECLEQWGGSDLVYVGEWSGGCNASPAFFEALAADFDELERIDIPQWAGINDALYIWRRS